MQKTGMIRKIDELGRIVLPKEIRNNLNIRENDNLEIQIQNEKLILKKIDKFLSYEEKVKKIISIFDKTFNLKIVVINQNEIVLNSKNVINLTSKVEITSELKGILNERKIYSNNNKVQLNWFKNYSVVASSYLYPIIINAELIGGIILFDNKKINEYQKALIKLIFILIKEY